MPMAWHFPRVNERAIASRKNVLRAFEGMSSELIPPVPRSRVGTNHLMYWTAGCGTGNEPVMYRHDMF